MGHAQSIVDIQLNQEATLCLSLYLSMLYE